MSLVIEGRPVLMRAGESVSDAKRRLETALNQVRHDEPFAQELREEILEWAGMFDNVPPRFVERRRAAYEEHARVKDGRSSTHQKEETEMSQIKQRPHESVAGASERARQTMEAAELALSPLDPAMDYIIEDVQASLRQSADLDASNVDLFVRERRRKYARIIEVGERAEEAEERCSEMAEMFSDMKPVSECRK